MPVTEEVVLGVRERAARAIQAVFDALGFPPISEAEVEAAITAYDTDDMPDRDKVADMEAAHTLLYGPLTVVDVLQTLEEAGFQDVAANILEMHRQLLRTDPEASGVGRRAHCVQGWNGNDQ